MGGLTKHYTISLDWAASMTPLQLGSNQAVVNVVSILAWIWTHGRVLDMVADRVISDLGLYLTCIIHDRPSSPC